MYVESLTSEESNQLIKEHLHSCKDFANYHRSVQRDLPNHDLPDVDAEKNDQKLMKDIQSMFLAIN